MGKWESWEVVKQGTRELGKRDSTGAENKGTGKRGKGGSGKAEKQGLAASRGCGKAGK